MKQLLLLYPLLLLVILTSPVHAETRYATDDFTVPVRSGASTRHKILRMVSSGTPLKILQTSDEGYTQVRTPEGTVGWMLTRYLMDQPPTRDQVEQLKERMTTLESENQTLRGDKDALEATRADLARCGEELADVRQAASQTLAIEEDNARLHKENAALQEQLLQLETQNMALDDASKRNWFLVGAGVVVGSLLLGLILPNIPLRRRRRWDQF
ncbi:MAG: TIGR04211 family SH3 domain-containing protein [Candidatus Competibacteraceae bacterium]|nr:TIGR04211 family SH3 domain-containing protein [Candidatus Competibacteraceae bacterium]